MFRVHTPIIRSIRCWIAAYGFPHRVFGWVVALSAAALCTNARHYLQHGQRSGAQDHHPSKNSVQKTICCNSTSNDPDDGRMYPKHVELRIHQWSYLVASSWHFTLLHDEDARLINPHSTTRWYIFWSTVPITDPWRTNLPQDYRHTVDHGSEL